MKFIKISLLFLLIACQPKNKQPNPSAPANTIADKPGENETPTGKIDIETLGPVKIGQASYDVLKALGSPATQSNPIEWGADGMMHEDWSWPEKGLNVNMVKEPASADSTQTVFSITAIPPCTFTTRAGIGLDKTYAEVQQAYKRDINPEDTHADQITVGSVYGGIIFTFTNNKVKRIFLGAAAE